MQLTIGLSHGPAIDFPLVPWFNGHADLTIVLSKKMGHITNRVHNISIYLVGFARKIPPFLSFPIY
jgi:hypothetical protein